MEYFEKYHLFEKCVVINNIKNNKLLSEIFFYTSHNFDDIRSKSYPSYLRGISFSIPEYVREHTYEKYVSSTLSYFISKAH